MYRQLAFAVAFSVFAGTGAQAFDILPPPNASGKTQHVILDSTPEINSLRGRSVDFNATFAPFGDAYETGFRFRLTDSASWYRFINGTDPITTYGSGRSNAVEMLPGFFLSLPRIGILGLAGLSVIDSVDDGVSTHRNAGKAVLSFYATPTDQTMAYGNYTYLTLNNAWMLQNKVGLKVPWNFYVGPEATFAGSDIAASRKLGLHVSGISLGGVVVVSFAAGQIHDRQLGNGGYFNVNFYGSF